MGKKGNKNAEKHGIFSKFIAVVDTDKELEGMKNNRNHAELAYARTRLKNAQEEYDNAKDTKEQLAWDYACRHWTEIIETMIYHNREQRETEKTIWQSLEEAIRAANDKQGVLP